MKMTKGPKLERDGRTAAKADEAEYLTGIRVAGYTGLKDTVMAEVHVSVADGAGTWGAPEDLTGAGGSGVSMKKPGAGAYHKYTKPKDTVHEES